MKTFLEVVAAWIAIGYGVAMTTEYLYPEPKSGGFELFVVIVLWPLVLLAYLVEKIFINPLRWMQERGVERQKRIRQIEREQEQARREVDKIINEGR